MGCQAEDDRKSPPFAKTGRKGAPPAPMTPYVCVKNKLSRKADSIMGTPSTGTRPTVLPGEGVTAAERYLAELCRRSFLSLWSYPAVFRDQGHRGGNGDGKEVCDLLVVFENH